MGTKGLYTFIYNKLFISRLWIFFENGTKLAICMTLILWYFTTHSMREATMYLSFSQPCQSVIGFLTTFNNTLHKSSLMIIFISLFISLIVWSLSAVLKKIEYNKHSKGKYYQQKYFETDLINNENTKYSLLNIGVTNNWYAYTCYWNCLFMQSYTLRKLYGWLM